MNEENRRLEVLKAEAAIRELAGRMAEASECTKQADMARSTLEAAVKSIDELSNEFRALIESNKGALKEDSKSVNHARESLDICTKDLQKAQEKFEKKAENLEASIGRKNQEFCEHLEIFSHRQNQAINDSFGAKLSNLSQDINTISNKLLFVMDQNEALTKRILALQQIIEELSCKFQEFGDGIASNSEEIQQLRTHIIDSNEKLSSLKYGLEGKTSGLVYRLRSAIRSSLS